MEFRTNLPLQIHCGMIQYFKSVMEIIVEEELEAMKQEGLESGRETTLLELIQKKLNRGLTVSAFADLLEIDTNTIQTLMKKAGIQKTP